jgi:hypothetical protein
MLAEHYCQSIGHVQNYPKAKFQGAHFNLEIGMLEQLKGRSKS